MFKPEYIWFDECTDLTDEQWEQIRLKLLDHTKLETIKSTTQYREIRNKYPRESRNGMLGTLSVK